MTNKQVAAKLIYVWFLEGDSFGQKQVPLTDEIKGILEDYPDGQIFKVSNLCVRNVVQQKIILCDTAIQVIVVLAPVPALHSGKPEKAQFIDHNSPIEVTVLLEYKNAWLLY